MRISREYFFDLCELVGKAITTARKKAAGPKWDLDEQLRFFARRHDIDLDRVDREIQANADQYGLFKDSPWKDPAPERDDSYSPYGSERFEQRRAQRHYDAFGDSTSSHLWEIMRQVRFKEIGVLDGMKELQAMCNGMAGYISCGWANRLAYIIDTHSK